MTDEVDMTDDWMNPRSTGWGTLKAVPPKNVTEFRILRMKATIVSGPSGTLNSWEFWSRHDTEAARDAELGRLRQEHPMWRLKATQGNPYLESIGIYPDA